jgi:alanyl-tRNA synthetase
MGKIDFTQGDFYMENMGLNEIREKFLSFFESKEHLRLKSFSLIPKNDPSILLINAGMTPLKPYFTGAKVPPAPRITTCQKCIRTPDIERVGKTARHGTYFEMLGNFSFGDYFKEEAIAWGWEFCTKVLNMPYEKLFVTVYHEDDEAYKIWNEKVGLPKEKIFKMGKEDNFWEHGTGPCGPCSEIFFDRGVEKGCKSPTCNVGCDCDRYVEFWNLVFTQFNKEEDGTYTPLAKKNIDTGGGLERFACIMQGVDNLFEVDTVKAILEYVCKITNVSYGKDAKTDTAIRVMTDHARSTVMMICDGILPDNAGRGYVLRRLLRRAARYGRLLGRNEPFLHDIASVVIRESAQAYPELAAKEDFIKTVILKEEESFARTVLQGMNILNEYIDGLKSGNHDTLTGDMVFKLHDTFGFPLDLTREIASENGCQIDEKGFFEAMSVQKKTTREISLKNRAGAAWGAAALPEEIKNEPRTIFVGYDALECDATLKFILAGNEFPQLTDKASAGDEITVIVEKTPFYAQSGGQSGDTGTIYGEGFAINITDTRKTSEGVVLHSGTVAEGNVAAGCAVTLSVDKSDRMATARNHTTTHLLHKALRMVLGDHVAQAGSDVSTKRLRFDFSHFSAMTPDERDSVEQIVNDAILSDYEVMTTIMTVEEAKDSGAIALFDDKYSGEVRVVSVGDFSKELCGGTHLRSSSQACLFKIVSESAVAAGVRRLEAVTGKEAMNMVFEEENTLKSASQSLKTSPAELVKRVDATLEKIRLLEKNLEAKQSELAKAGADKMLDDVIESGDLKLLFTVVDSDNADELRNMADKIKDLLGECVVVLGSVQDDKISFVAMATKNAVAKGAHAGNIIKETAKVAGGGGGGRPDMAQAGGKDTSKIGDAMAKAKEVCLGQLEK